jgi:hypothetical protein
MRSHVSTLQALGFPEGRAKRNGKGKAVIKPLLGHDLPVSTTSHGFVETLSI